MRYKYQELTSSEAIEYLLNNTPYTSYYKLAQFFNSKGYKTRPIQFSQWRRGINNISIPLAKIFEDLFNISISDKYKPRGRPPLDYS